MGIFIVGTHLKALNQSAGIGRGGRTKVSIARNDNFYEKEIWGLF
jgi:hypothetical protein